MSIIRETKIIYAKDIYILRILNLNAMYLFRIAKYNMV